MEKQPSYKDPNEWLIAIGKDAFSEDIKENILNEFTEKTIDYYLNDYIEDIKTYARKPIISTGFKLLDEQLGDGIRDGLYILGAMPSTRKNNLFTTSGGQYSKRRTKSNYFQFRAVTF